MFSHGDQLSALSRQLSAPGITQFVFLLIANG
jgi:hypothetical protein